MEDLSSTDTDSHDQPRWPEATVPDLPAPKWSNNSCGIDCIMWIMRNARIFDNRTDEDATSRISLPEIESLKVQQLEVKDLEATMALQRRTIEVMRVTWALAGPEAVNLWRRELVNLWHKARGLTGKINEYVPVAAAWEIMTAPAESLICRTIYKFECECSAAKFGKCWIRRLIYLTADLDGRLNGPAGTFKKVSLEQLMSAYFASQARGGGCGSPKCPPSAVKHNFVQGALPRLLVVKVESRKAYLADKPVSFRYYAITPSKQQKRRVTYLVRAVVLGLSDHFTAIWYNWEGDRLMGGWRYNGMGRKGRTETLTASQLMDLLKTNVEDNGEFVNIPFMMLEKSNEVVESEAAR